VTRCAPKGPALDLVLELNGEWHDHQRIAGVNDPNSGGNVVFLSPGCASPMGAGDRASLDTRPDRLIAATTPRAGKVELHRWCSSGPGVSRSL
jgi:hypothetical protein